MTPSTTRENIERFAEAAASWDEKPQRVELARAVAAAIKKYVPLSADEEVLEFGCGTGLVTVQIAPYVGSILAVDSSKDMLAVLEEKISKQGISSITPLAIHLDASSKPGQLFDLIFSSMTLHHIDDVAGLLALFHSMLKPGGRIAIADLEKEDGSFHDDNRGVVHHGFATDAFQQMLTDANFSDIECHRAHVIEKNTENGDSRSYPVFLAIGTKA